ncbi:MAG: SMC-Scp complex subunit ScpB [Planctomycetota bacterium]
MEQRSEWVEVEDEGAPGGAASAADEPEGELDAEADVDADVDADVEADGEADGEAEDEAEDEADGELAAEPEGHADAGGDVEPDELQGGVEEPGETEDVTRGPGPGADLSDEELLRRTAALLFASPEPLSIARLVSLLERPPAARVRAAVESLGHALDTAGLPLQVRGLRGGYTLMTAPELGQVVARLAKGPTIERISGAALETLAIVAYRQPATKAEIEAIRGVQAGPILRTLVDRGLVKVVGRADVPGHPLQYGTGKEFLDRFGLMNLEELPRDAELARG